MKPFVEHHLRFEMLGTRVASDNKRELHAVPRVCRHVHVCVSQEERNRHITSYKIIPPQQQQQPRGPSGCL